MRDTNEVIEAVSIELKPQIIQIMLLEIRIGCLVGNYYIN